MELDGEDESKNCDKGRNEWEDLDLNPRKGLEGVGEEDSCEEWCAWASCWFCVWGAFCGLRIFMESGLLFLRDWFFTGVGACSTVTGTGGAVGLDVILVGCGVSAAVGAFVDGARLSGSL